MAKPKLAKIPAGWELVPVGCKITVEDKVCSHPHKRWTLAYGASDTTIVQKDGSWCPYGYYIRRKTKKARK